VSQKYRADRSETQADGAICWFADWMGGPTLSKINKCRIDGLGDKRLTVYITGEDADLWFSVPASTRYRGQYVRGYVTSDDAGYIFHARDNHKSRLVSSD
jgi:hypothetical protein